MSEEKKEEQNNQSSPPQTETQTNEQSQAVGSEQDAVEVPEKFKELVEKIEQMSVLELSELVKILEKKFGVTAAPPPAGVPAAGGASPATESAAEEEKSSFNLELTEAGSNKIAVIKLVRDITQKGLKEAKELVDGVPQIIKEGATKEEAEELKKKFEEAGARITLK